MRAAKAADEQKMREEIAALLGPDRAAQFEQTGNPDFQSLTLLAERFDLPPEVSQAVLDMRRLAEEARRQLLSNQDLPADRRNAALNAIQAEAERATARLWATRLTPNTLAAPLGYGGWAPIRPPVWPAPRYAASSSRIPRPGP